MATEIVYTTSGHPLPGLGSMTVEECFLGEAGAVGNELLPGWVHSWWGTTSAGQLPLPPTCRAFLQGATFRPPRHNRSFYVRGEGPGVIAVKGTEPLVADFGELLEHVAAEISVAHASEPRRAAEHFASIERKVPCAVTLDEARGEASKALALHAASLRHYGALAHVPFPLGVLKLSDEVSARVMDRVRATVTGTALGQLEPFTRNGLGVLVNYYAGMPTRVSSLNHVLPTTSYAERHERLFELLDPDVVMRSWSRQLARLLHLGFVPATPASGRTGNMCQPQNAALDGGFFDVDSVEPICTLPGPAAVADALAASMRSFYYTVRSMLVERSYYHLGSADDVVEGWITSYVHTSMRRALAEEALPRVDLDPRVAQFFSADVELPDLLAALAAYHPTSSLQQARAEARDFLRAHPWMLPTTDGNRHPGQT
jgi:hypothetical protein